MKLRFTPQATQDLIDIAAHIRAENPPAADRVRGAILGALQVLVSFPKMGRRQTAEGVRKLVTRRYGYLVYYFVDPELDEIAVLAIRHPARERPAQDL